MKEGLVNLNMALVPDNQSSKIPNPSKGALDLPPFPVAPEFSTVLRLRFTSVFTMWRNQINFNAFQPLAQRIAVIASVGNQPLRSLFGPSSLSILTKNCTDFTELKVYHPASLISWQSMAGYPPFAVVVL